MGVLTPEKTQFLSRLVFTIFSPTFNLHALARAVSLDSLKTLWMLPIINIIQTTVGNVLGRLIFFRKFWRGALDYEQQQVHIVTETFNNGVTLPLVFMSAICKISAGGVLFAQEVDSAVQSSMAYINVYTIPSIFMFWSYGLSALNRPDEEKTPSTTLNEDDHVESHMLKDSSDNHSVESTENDTTPNITDIQELIEENHLDIESAEVMEPIPEEKTGFMEHLKKIYHGKAFSKIMFILKQSINGPVIAIIIGLIIGLIEPVKTFLITNPPMVVSSFVHLLAMFAT